MRKERRINRGLRRRKRWEGKIGGKRKGRNKGRKGGRRRRKRRLRRGKEGKVEDEVKEKGKRGKIRGEEEEKEKGGRQSGRRVGKRRTVRICSYLWEIKGKNRDTRNFGTSRKYVLLVNFTLGLPFLHEKIEWKENPSMYRIATSEEPSRKEHDRRRRHGGRLIRTGDRDRNRGRSRDRARGWQIEQGAGSSGSSGSRKHGITEPCVRNRREATGKALVLKFRLLNTFRCHTPT